MKTNHSIRRVIFILITFTTFPIKASTLPNAANSLALQYKDRIIPSCYIQPCSFQGDFNGDKQLDTAILVIEKATAKRGIAIVEADGKITLLGAGKRLNQESEDHYDWLDHWELVKKGPVGKGATQETPPTLKGDALLLEKTESASGLVYWNGKTYDWYQQGD